MKQPLFRSGFENFQKFTHSETGFLKVGILGVFYGQKLAEFWKNWFSNLNSPFPENQPWIWFFNPWKWRFWKLLHFWVSDGCILVEILSELKVSLYSEFFWFISLAFIYTWTDTKYPSSVLTFRYTEVHNFLNFISSKLIPSSFACPVGKSWSSKQYRSGIIKWCSKINLIIILNFNIQCGLLRL